MGHRLNLVVQEYIANTVEGENALEIFNKVSKFVTASLKRLKSFHALQYSMSETQDHLNSLSHPLGPTKGVSRRFSQQLRKAVGLAVRHVQLDRCRCPTEISSSVVSFVIGEV